MKFFKRTPQPKQYVDVETCDVRVCFDGLQDDYVKSFVGDYYPGLYTDRATFLAERFIRAKGPICIDKDRTFIPRSRVVSYTIENVQEKLVEVI